MSIQVFLCTKYSNLALINIHHELCEPHVFIDFRLLFSQWPWFNIMTFEDITNDICYKVWRQTYTNM